MKGFRLWTDFRWIVRAAGHISIPVGWMAGWQPGTIVHLQIWQITAARTGTIATAWRKICRRKPVDAKCREPETALTRRCIRILNIWFRQWLMCHARNLRLRLSWKKRFRLEQSFLSFASRSAAGEEAVDDVRKLYFKKRTVTVHWSGKFCYWWSSSFPGYTSRGKTGAGVFQLTFCQKKLTSGKICKTLWSVDHRYRKRQQS